MPETIANEKSGRVRLADAANGNVDTVCESGGEGGSMERQAILREQRDVGLCQLFRDEESPGQRSFCCFVDSGD